MCNSDVASEETFVIEFVRLYRIFHKTHQTSRSFFSAFSSYFRVFRDRRDFRRHMRACSCRAHRRSISQTLNADGTSEIQFTVFPTICSLSLPFLSLSLPLFTFSRKGGALNGPRRSVRAAVKSATTGEDNRVASCNSKLFQ